MPAVPVATRAVIGVSFAKLAVGIFMTPRAVFAINRNSLPPWLYTIMSIGRFWLPSSAIVVPVILAPGVSCAIGNLTSGVHRYAAMRVLAPATLYGTNEYTGDRVSSCP